MKDEHIKELVAKTYEHKEITLKEKVIGILWDNDLAGKPFADIADEVLGELDHAFKCTDIVENLPSVGDIEVVLLGWFDCEMNNKNIMNIAKAIKERIDGM